MTQKRSDAPTAASTGTPAEDAWITQKAAEEDGALVLAGSLPAPSEPGPAEQKILSATAVQELVDEISSLRAQLQELRQRTAKLRLSGRSGVQHLS